LWAGYHAAPSLKRLHWSYRPSDQPLPLGSSRDPFEARQGADAQSRAFNGAPLQGLWCHEHILFCMKTIFRGLFGERASHRIGKHPLVSFINNHLFFRNPASAHRSVDTFVLPRNKLLWHYIDSGEERRYFIALHRERLNRDGPYVSLVHMEPRYEQPFHKHARRAEFNFLLDPATVRVGAAENAEDVMVLGGALVYIPANVFHTVANHTRAVSRNLTVKPSFDHRIFCDDGQKRARGLTIVPTELGEYRWGSRSSYEITTRDGFRYAIEYLSVLPGGEATLRPSVDRALGSDRLLINFSPAAVSMIEGARIFALAEGDVLYSRSNRNLHVSNQGKEPARLYRLTVLDPTKAVFGRK
jgi:mannose-6-phosphate isomerase-like protein (cupin superfamily)